MENIPNEEEAGGNKLVLDENPFDVIYEDDLLMGKEVDTLLMDEHQGNGQIEE